jgi:hypothetical protein
MPILRGCPSSPAIYRWPSVRRRDGETGLLICAGDCVSLVSAVKQETNPPSPPLLLHGDVPNE